MEIPILPEMVSVWQETLSWQPNDEQQRLFQRLYELVLQGNRQLNLTRITEPIDFWEKHLWDSLRGIKNSLSPIPNSQSPREDKGDVGVGTGAPPLHQFPIPKPQVIDIGTGAGFPGLPIAIVQPNWTLTLLDSTRKKIAFLETLLAELSIKNAMALTGRSEEIAKQPQYRSFYDIALVRAVGSASICAEYALPLLKIGGLAILYRGQQTDEEITALQTTLDRLGGIIETIEEFTTPLSKSVRHCLYLRKNTSTLGGEKPVLKLHYDKHNR